MACRIYLRTWWCIGLAIYVGPLSQQKHAVQEDYTSKNLSEHKVPRGIKWEIFLLWSRGLTFSPEWWPDDYVMRKLETFCIHYQRKTGFHPCQTGQSCKMQCVIRNFSKNSYWCYCGARKQTPEYWGNKHKRSRPCCTYTRKTFAEFMNKLCIFCKLGSI